MSIVSSFCKQRAVYFAPSTTDKFGNTSFEAGVEIKCRWESGVAEVIVGSGDGAAVKVVSKHRIIADRALQEGGILWKGTLVDWTALGLTVAQVNTSLENHDRIITTKETPTVRANDVLHEVWM